MDILLDLLLFIARVVLVAYCGINMLFVLTGTARTYAEWSKGFGGFLYIGGVVLVMLHVGPLFGRDVGRVMNAVGLALVALPPVLQHVSPRLYNRLTQLEDC